MWWSDAVLPRWFMAPLVFLVASVAGFVAAFAAFWVVLWIDIGWLAHADTGVAVAAGGALVIGLAAASGRSEAAQLRRGAAAAGVLFVLGAGAIVARETTATYEFDAAAFRGANASGDDDALEDQARRAVASGALVALPAAEVRRVLGEPTRSGRRVWSRHLGTINDALGVGDSGSLFVRFDPATRRVIAAKVDTSP